MELINYRSRLAVHGRKISFCELGKGRSDPLKTKFIRRLRE
jgi:hypothetical protein